ncbi:nitroreductase family protein [Wenxinia marina]|uniref:Nitroreductase n=1 Tax=Wenxinia marina DSM 24838 TaxID=1123501 RepID=A0A0D0PFB1_9RHOB|nr:nitroreductase family protein [Wenxinia marina]KIQ70046.1 Nitroreductase [Wenxinia marina DSM 24838]GGL63123.1 nitroreductase [Wenxinia marina]
MSTRLEELLARRRSIRAFTGRTVSRVEIEALLAAARRAPSGANLQPGAFHVLTGAPLADLSAALQDALKTDAPTSREYSWFPAEMPAELKARQRAAGYALYEALGIGRRDLDGRRRQWARNYDFFGAPVGIVVTIRRDMGAGGFMDLGMALMALMLAATERGLAATGIGALATYASVVHARLGLPEEEMVVCGLAVGAPDEGAPVNAVRTERAPVSDFATFSGFD